jgi:hypothetical protein
MDILSYILISRDRMAGMRDRVLRIAGSCDDEQFYAALALFDRVRNGIVDEVLARLPPHEGPAFQTYRVLTLVGLTPYHAACTLGFPHP